MTQTVDYTGAKIMNLTMTSADGRDQIVYGPVSFQKLRRLVLSSLSLSDLFKNFNVFKSPRTHREHYKKYEFCGDNGTVDYMYMYNVNANEVMRDLTKSMTMNVSTNFVLDVKLKNGIMVNISHDASKLLFSRYASIDIAL